MLHTACIIIIIQLAYDTTPGLLLQTSNLLFTLFWQKLRVIQIINYRTIAFSTDYNLFTREVNIFY